MKTYVINLARAVERRVYMEQQLQRLGIDYEIFPAVDGQELSEEDLQQYSSKDSKKLNGRELSKNEIGCALSHLRIYEKLISSGEENVLILEDDINIGQMFVEILRHKEKLPPDWEFINFITDAKEQPFGPPIFDIYRPSRFKNRANRCAANLVNVKGARKLAGHARPIRTSSDGLTGRTEITGLISYGIYPRVVTLREVESTIGAVPKGRRTLKSVVRSVKSAVRKVIRKARPGFREQA